MIHSAEPSDRTKTTRRNIPENDILHMGVESCRFPYKYSGKTQYTSRRACESWYCFSYLISLNQVNLIRRNKCMCWGIHERDVKEVLILDTKQKTNSVAFSPQANYTDWATATCRRNLVLTFMDRGVSRGQRGGAPTAVNLGFLDRSRYFSFK
jgi:hypothetical protein